MSDRERGHLNAIIQVNSRRLQGLELQAAGIGRIHQAAVASSIKAIKQELAHLQDHINASTQPEGQQLAQAITSAIDDLEQRVHTIILEEAKAARTARPAIRPRSANRSQQQSMLPIVAFVGMFLALAGMIALMVRRQDSTAAQPLPATLGDQGSIAPEQMWPATEFAAQQAMTTPTPTTGQPVGPTSAQATAIARPVWLQVNRSLLQATIIDAVRSGPPLAPAAATALQIQYEGNFATIEALRPTANALGIVLWEHPVQPTDAAEATLFAQADEAARSSRYPAQMVNPSTPEASLRPTVEQ